MTTSEDSSSYFSATVSPFKIALALTLTEQRCVLHHYTCTPIFRISPNAILQALHHTVDLTRHVTQLAQDLLRAHVLPSRLASLLLDWEPENLTNPQGHTALRNCRSLAVIRLLGSVHTIDHKSKNLTALNVSQGKSQSSYLRSSAIFTRRLHAQDIINKIRRPSPHQGSSDNTRFTSAVSNFRSVR